MGDLRKPSRQGRQAVRITGPHRGIFVIDSVNDEDPRMREIRVALSFGVAQGEMPPTGRNMAVLRHRYPLHSWYARVVRPEGVRATDWGAERTGAGRSGACGLLQGVSQVFHLEGLLDHTLEAVFGVIGHDRVV